MFCTQPPQGVSPAGLNAYDDLYQLIAERYEKRPTVITSEGVAKLPLTLL